MERLKASSRTTRIGRGGEIIVDDIDKGTDTSTSASSTVKSMSVFVWQPGDGGRGMGINSFMTRSKVNFHVGVALALLVVALIFIIISFCTPYWLETDGSLENPKFISIGLWEGCFNNLKDDGHRYDNVISGCWYLLAEELYHLWDLIYQPFFVAVQFFFTICFITLLMSCVLVTMYLLCFGPDHLYYVLLIKVIGILLIFSAMLGTIAVITFGAMGDSRHWMPDWQNNYLSWSFALGVVGVFCEYVSGILFLVEGRIQGRKRKLRESASAYTMETKA